MGAAFRPWLLATAKVKHGGSLERAQAELDRIAANLGEAYPDTNRNRGLLAIPMLEERNRQLGATLYPLLGAVAFVLLIACTNVANLLLTRAIARRREISVRAALGAGRQRLCANCLRTESCWRFRAYWLAWRSRTAGSLYSEFLRRRDFRAQPRSS